MHQFTKANSLHVKIYLAINLILILKMCTNMWFQEGVAVTISGQTTAAHSDCQE